MKANPLEPVLAFSYLGRTVAFNNSKWAALYHNLRKARHWWEMMLKMLTRTGMKVWEREIIYKAVVQTVLLYGSNIWLVTGEM